MKTVHAVILVLALFLGANSHAEAGRINRQVLGKYRSRHANLLMFISTAI
jgi:hypothetical protein